MTTVAGAMKVPTACEDHPGALITDSNASLRTGTMVLILVDNCLDCGISVFSKPSLHNL